MMDHEEVLRLLRRLLDQGHRPGRLINLPIEQLAELADQAASEPVSGAELASNQPLEQFIDLIRAHRVDDLRRELSQLVLRLGIERFVGEVASPNTPNKSRVVPAGASPGH